MAWSAAKNAGWHKGKDGNWKKKGESEASYYNWLGFWKRVEYQTPYGFDRSAVEALGTVDAKESLVPFRARILLAVPGKSLNNRIYPRETLQQATPFYEGKPFILDHDIEHAERVVGLITRPRYGVEEGYNGEKKEGMWADGLGLMDRNMFDRLAGKGPVPPLIRGVSIGGQGDGQYDTDGGTLIKNFNPAELSVTAFPGIPDAHIAELNLITENYRQQGLLSHRSRMNISLDEAKRQARKSIEKATRMPIREIGSGPGQTNTPVVGSNPRPGIRGLNASVDSVPRQNIAGIVPSDPQLPDVGLKVDPYNTPSGVVPFQSIGSDKYAGLKGQSSTEGMPAGSGGTKSSRDANAWTPKTPKLGRTTTQTPGWGGLSPSGTGITDQDEALHKARVQATVASLQNDMDRVLYAMKTGRVPEAKIDISKPEEDEEEEEEKAREEEEEEEEHVLMRHLLRLEQKKLARELDYDLGNQKQPIYKPSDTMAMSGYQRTINPGVDVTHNPPNEAGFDRSIYKAGSRPSAYAPQESYQPTREEEDFVKSNPLKSGEEEEEEEERVIRNRIIRLRMARLFPEAAPGAERPYTRAPSPKTPSLGQTTTKTPGFGNLSPSGTGIKDQPEEEEEEETITLNGIRYRREQTTKPALDKDTGVSGEEEEEEEAMPRNPGSLLAPGDGKSTMGNPLMKVQRDPDRDGDQDNTGANPVQAGGEEAQDLIPNEGHAPSLAMGMGQTLYHRLFKKTEEPSKEQMRQMIETFNALKQPRVEQPKKIIVKTAESRTTSRPSVVPSLPGVPARGMMSNNPTLSQPYQTVSQDTRGQRQRMEQLLAEVKKEPFGQYNLAGNLWKRMLPEIMEIQR